MSDKKQNVGKDQQQKASNKDSQQAVTHLAGDSHAVRSQLIAMVFGHDHRN